MTVHVIVQNIPVPESDLIVECYFGRLNPQKIADMIKHFAMQAIDPI